MRNHLVTVLLAALLAACSNSGSGGGDDTGGGGGGGGGGSSQAPSDSCQAVPTDVPASCSVYGGGDSDAGTGGTLEFCNEYSGSVATASVVQQSCALIDGNGTYGVVSSSSCPTANQLGGTCLGDCGTAFETVTFWYTTSALTEAEVQQQRTGATDTYLP